jgi:streptogramin lyase
MYASNKRFTPAICALLVLFGCGGSGSSPPAKRPTGTIVEFTIPTGNSWPLDIAAGPDGNLWFTERGGAGTLLGPGSSLN